MSNRTWYIRQGSYIGDHYGSDPFYSCVWDNLGKFDQENFTKVIEYSAYQALEAKLAITTLALISCKALAHNHGFTHATELKEGE